MSAETPAVPKRPHISPSQINTYTNCGVQYERRYIRKEIIPPGAAAIRGSSVHKGAEMNFSQKIETRADLPASQIVERAAAEFDARVKVDGVFLSAEDEARGKKIVLGEEKDSTVRLAGIFASDVAPVYQPKAVETEVRIELPNSPRDILGIIDLEAEIVADPARGVGIVDHKTGKKTKSQAEFDASPQLSIYDLAFRAKHGKPPAFIQVEQLIDTKTPKRVLTTTTRSKRDFEVAIARVNATIQGIEKGVFVPANAGWWGCSAKRCGYAPTCPFYNAERKAAAEAVS